MINKNYSTTGLLTKQQPVIEKEKSAKFEFCLFLPVNEQRKDEGGLRTKGYFKASAEDKPLITVITVVYNGEKYLEETIKSVINQTYKSIEYIIKKYNSQVNYWVSELDNGIYDAMNKGILLAKGNYIGIINLDNCYKVIDILRDNILYNKLR